MEYNSSTKDNDKYNFEFCFDENKKPIVKITPEFLEPKILFKFYSLTKYNFEALNENYLYASHPYELNDPLDCSHKLIDFSNIDKPYFEYFYKKYFKGDYNQKKNDEMFFVDGKRKFSDFADYYISSLSNRYGSISFAKNFNNILMWSHYSTHNGFCIEFDKGILINECENYNSDINHFVFRPMAYMEEMKSLDFKELCNNEDANLIPIYISTYKNKIWDYEEEYRITIFKEDMNVPFNRRGKNFKGHKGKQERQLKYNPKSINKIILGQNFFQSKHLFQDNSTFKIDLEDEIIEIEDVIKRNEVIIYLKFLRLISKNYCDKIYILKVHDIKGKLDLLRQKINIKFINNTSFEVEFTDDILAYDYY